MTNLFLFLGEAFVYGTIMITLLHLRQRLGLGVFIAALGVMHFIETYLAAVFYVQLPFGVISPGSAVLFSGKLMLILLLYVKEDAATVRQPIYGLLIGNFLTVSLGFILQQHVTVPVVPGRIADLAFIDEMGWLMVWGTVLLYIDSLIIILVYEKFGRRLRRFVTLRFFLCGAAVLTFDQAGFFIALHAMNGAPAEVFWGGWLAKMGAAAFYSVLLGTYLHFSNHTVLAVSRRPIGDIFNDLTFRERYEDLLSRSGRDSLTGTLDRGRFEFDGTLLVRNAVTTGTPASLMIIDADHFKGVNDHLGHPEGDRVLKAIVASMKARLGPTDHLFRYGGEEFVILSEDMNATLALQHAEDIRAGVEAVVRTSDQAVVTISIGVASTPQDGSTLKDLLSRADAMLYQAKANGRNRVESGITA